MPLRGVSRPRSLTAIFPHPSGDMLHQGDTHPGKGMIGLQDNMLKRLRSASSLDEGKLFVQFHLNILCSRND